MVQQSQMPILVDFYAPWCGPCQLMSKVVAVIPSSCKLASKCKMGADLASPIKLWKISGPFLAPPEFTEE